MKFPKFKKYQLISLALILVAVMANQSFAQLVIKKHSINNGGSPMIGGGYSMNASVAQVDATNAYVGGSYILTGGFWLTNTATTLNTEIFKDGFE